MSEPTPSHANRRDFLKRISVAGAGVVAGATGFWRLSATAGSNEASRTATCSCGSASNALNGPLPHAADATGRAGVPGRKWVMVVDLAKCEGCGKCSVACSKAHHIPSDRQWIPVLALRDAPTEAPYYFPRPCFHCDNPPCTKVCPVGATYKTQDGTVLIDNDRCIGCRLCMAACPYGVRCFNWGHPQNPPEADVRGYSPEWGYPRKVGTVEKCDFCPDMAAAGLLPHCSSGCPFGTIYFGDENEDAVTNSRGETLRFSKLLRDRAGYRHLEYLGTAPRCYYLPPINRQFPAPDQAKKKA